LGQHPDIYIPPIKEVHYFDLNWHRGIEWYMDYFKDTIAKKYKAVGEASPFYMYLERVPKRIHKTISDIKLIFILRNPVDRAYSHYWHEVKLGYEWLSFQEAIKKEEERLLNGDLFAKQHYSYIDRGKYVIQLKRFEEYFNKEQMLVLITEELQKNPERVMKGVFKFLGVDTFFRSQNGYTTKYNVRKIPRNKKLQRISSKIPETLIGKYIKYVIHLINLKEGGYEAMDLTTKKYLQTVFNPYNKRLEKFLGRKLDIWEESNVMIK